MAGWAINELPKQIEVAANDEKIRKKLKLFQRHKTVHFHLIRKADHRLDGLLSHYRSEATAKSYDAFARSAIALSFTIH